MAQEERSVTIPAAHRTCNGRDSAPVHQPSRPAHRRSEGSSCVSMDAHVLAPESSDQAAARRFCEGAEGAGCRGQPAWQRVLHRLCGTDIVGMNRSPCAGTRGRGRIARRMTALCVVGALLLAVAAPRGCRADAAGVSTAGDATLAAMQQKAKMLQSKCAAPSSLFFPPPCRILILLSCHCGAGSFELPCKGLRTAPCNTRACMADLTMNCGPRRTTRPSTGPSRRVPEQRL